MARVAIVTDSNAYLSPRLAERLGVIVLPHTIHLPQGSFKEGVNLTPSQYFRMVQDSKRDVLPSASGPSLEEFIDLYGQLFRQTDQILSLHISSHLSKTVENAHMASKLYLGRCRIAVSYTHLTLPTIYSV